MTTAVVVGGGLAGISAALRLVDAGCDVTLLEAKPKLGGLTHSFRRGDLDVDNGQHVFMRCCTSYRALLDRLGTTALTTLQPRLDVPVVRRLGARAVAGAARQRGRTRTPWRGRDGAQPREGGGGRAEQRWLGRPLHRRGPPHRRRRSSDGPRAHGAVASARRIAVRLRMGGAARVVADRGPAPRLRPAGARGGVRRRGRL